MSNDTVREIVQRISIVETIGKYIPLTKKGSNFFGLSPFKNEKTPSFSVSEEKKMFKCFSTGEGGNVFDFLIKVKGYTFKEALYELAEKSGVEISLNNSSESFKTLYEINNFAKNYFHKNLFNNKLHYEYLINKRKFTKESIDYFSLGSISNTKDFIDALLSNFNSDDLIKSAILRENNNKLYSFFSNRIIIPIINSFDKVVGFGARSIGEDLPKYINTSETKAFKKKNILYNEKSLTKNIDKSIIITEGYFDVIKMHQAGITNVVAPLGTAINHTKIIEITKRGLECIICLDGDAAGRNSMLRLLDNLIKDENFDLGVKFVLLPVNQDPDQLIDENKISLLKDLINSPLSLERFIEKYLEKFSKSSNIEIQYKGKKFIKKLIEDIANKDLKELLKAHFKDFNFQATTPPNNTDIIIKNDLKSKFSAGIILTYIEVKEIREEVLDLLIISKFDGIFEDIRKLITKKDYLVKSSEAIFNELDLKRLNFNKNKLFSREIRRLCKFANPTFKGNLYLEIEKAITYINKND